MSTPPAAASGGAMLPERLDDPGLAAAGLEVRAWRESDADAMSEVIEAELEHLRPFMPWVVDEPIPREARRALVRGWEEARRAGRDAVYGIFRDGAPVGGVGAHARIAPDGREVGYWLRAQEQGRGTITRVVRVLTDVLLAQPGVTHVEIHMDPANLRSAAVPERCGYRLVGQVAREAVAPAETGSFLVWRIGTDPVDSLGSAAATSA